MKINFKTPADNIGTITAEAKPATLTNMHVQLETMTPELAAELLEKNTDNRPVKERHVSFLSDQMLSGAWQVTGDPIKVSRSGRLLDGQHRLRAICLSRTTQSIYVAWDCEEEIFSVLDTGRSRSASDVLSTAGIKNYTLLASAAKLLLMQERGVLSNMANKQRMATNSAVLAYVQKHDLGESGVKAQAWTKRCKLLNPAEWCALHYLFTQMSKKQADAFLEQISTGLQLTEGHPVFLLRQKLQAARDGARYNYTASERMALTVKAWNAYRSAKMISHLVWRPTDEFPEIL
jgi:hypothetical protein